MIFNFNAFCGTILIMKHDQARNFTFRLPSDVYAVVSAEAKERGITVTRLVRLALAAFLEANGRSNALVRSEAANG
jgi:hypothetical protein